jgi:hypothetical protein
MMEGFAAVVGVIGALSLGVTKVVDFLRNVLDKADTYPKYVWNIVAFVVGIAFAVGWHQNITEQLTALVPALADVQVDGVPGEIITGIVIGGFAGFWHELLDALSGVATRTHGG